LVMVMATVFLRWPFYVAKLNGLHKMWISSRISGWTGTIIGRKKH
jgi:hypothetical protein